MAVKVKHTTVHSFGTHKGSPKFKTTTSPSLRGPTKMHHTASTSTAKPLLVVGGSLVAAKVARKAYDHYHKPQPRGTVQAQKPMSRVRRKSRG